MSPRSGMTLVEVLAALVLLTLIATATIPVLRSAFGTLRAPPVGEEFSDLVQLADAFVADPAAFGFLGELPESGVLVRTDAAGLELARFWVLASKQADVEHAWVAVEAEGMAVFRCLEEGPR